MRNDFLWMIFDHIQTHFLEPNNAPGIAIELAGGIPASHKTYRAWLQLAGDAISTLRVAGLLHMEKGCGFGATRKLNRDQFNTIFAGAK